MQRLEVSGAVQPIYGSLGVKRLMFINVLRHVTGFHVKALMKTTMLHPYSLVAEWAM